MYIYIYMCIYTFVYIHPPAPMNLVKILKGCPPRDASSELVQLWYKKVPPDHDGRVEMKLQLDGVIKPVPHDVVRRIGLWILA